MAPGGLVEVHVSWPGHPRYLKKKKLEPHPTYTTLGVSLLGTDGQCLIMVGGMAKTYSLTNEKTQSNYQL